MTEPMSREQMYAVLLVEPYNLSFAQIARLTQRQIRRILFRPRSDKGEPLSDREIADLREEKRQNAERDRALAAGEAIMFPTYRHHFWHWSRTINRRGEAETEALWEEWLSTNEAGPQARQQWEAWQKAQQETAHGGE